MQKVLEQVYQTVADVMKMPEELNTLAETYRAEGYRVERGLAGTVILKLDDGEVHFVPGAVSISQLVFRY